MLFEEPAEMLGIFKAQLECDFVNRLFAIEYALLGSFNNLHLNVFLSGLAGLFLDQVTEVFGRQIKLAGALRHCR